MSGELAISVSGLGKRYRLGLNKARTDTLVDVLAGAFGSLARKAVAKPSTSDEFWALKDVSFEIRRGENVGVIGLNGAGKSTLLKIISRITTPTTGVARIDGRVGALLEVGTGFHQELTGRENVFLYGSILGMSKAEIQRKFKSIVEFAELERFTDTPVKRYSSGMYVRLAFAVAAHLDPEILLLDEVLAVGDLKFQRKCMDMAKGLQRKNATILFVSHNMFSIKTMCERAIYLKGGQIVFDGATDAAIEHYENDSNLSPLPWARTDQEQWPIEFTSCELSDAAGERKSVFDHGEQMRVRIRFRTNGPVARPNFIVAFIRSDGVACCNYSSETDGVVIDRVEGESVVELLTPPIPLVSEAYHVSILAREEGFQQLIGAQRGPAFHIRHDLFDPHFGVFHERAEWSCDGERVMTPEPSLAREHG